MRAIIRALFGRSQTNRTAAEPGPADTATAQRRLAEFQKRLSDIFVKDPLQVVGRAFIIEILDKDDEPVRNSDAYWRKPFEGLIQTAAGVSGFYRTVSASIYFVRLNNIHQPDGSLYCDLLKAQLGQLIEGEGLHLKFSAALPGPSGQIEFVPFEASDKLNKIIEALMLAAGKTVASLTAESESETAEETETGEDPQSSDQPREDEKSKPDGAETKRDEDPRRNPQWHVDDVWDPVKTLALWQENATSDAEDGPARSPAEWKEEEVPERQMPAASMVVEEPAPQKNEEQTPDNSNFTTSADRLKKVEAEISGQITNLTLAFYPVWNATTRKAIRTCVTPSLKAPDNTWSNGDDLFGRGLSAALSCELDCSVIEKFVAIREVVQPRNPNKFIIPVHYAAIKNRHMCFSLLEAAKKFEAEKPDLVIVGINEPDSARTIQVVNQILAPVVGEFWLEFSTPGLLPVDIDRGFANWVGFEVSSTIDDNRLAELSGKFAESANAKSLKPFARGKLSKQALMILPALGVDTFATPLSSSRELEKQHLAIPFAANNITSE